jgi:probable rRNA maturation factor
LSSLTLKKVKGPAYEKRSELSIVLTGDSEVRLLNRQYRKKDKTTDVLSFPLLEGKKLMDGLNGLIPLGDVVISVPQTRRQAIQLGREFRQELALLLVHGILHLLGYDHVTRSQEKKMFNLQDRLLRKFTV